MFESTRSLKRAAAALAVLLSCHGAFAQTIFTSNTTISHTDVSFDGQDIIVRGCTLTIDGAHTFNSIVVERSPANQPGVLTHSAGFSTDVNGVFITTIGDIFIEGADGALVASRIDLNARGHAPATGLGATPNILCCNNRTGGAGHGGAGGNGVNLVGGACYGSVVAPSQLGSGSGASYIVPGAAGGGAIHLIVGAALHLHGELSADGAPGGSGVNGSNTGGGSGGSIWIQAGSFLGDGSLSARGGDGGGPLLGGGGGGGRIAVIAGQSFFKGTFDACGGAGFVHGGAGTVYTDFNGARTVSIANCVTPGASTEFSGETTLDADVLVARGAILGPPIGEDGFHLTITGDLTIDALSAVSADRRGYSSGQGPGASPTLACCSNPTGGAGHAGAGGNGTNQPGGDCYGSVTEPETLGSGAGSSYIVSGGVGGGAIRLSILGDLLLDGRISADAGDGAAGVNSSYTGGGSGGSLWISAAALSGAGSISAHGGDGATNAGTPQAGGGGGGRIALYYDSSSFAGQIAAFGGSGNVAGGAGTILVKPAASRATLTIDNNAVLGEATEFTGDVTLDANLIVRRQGLLSHKHEDSGLHVTFLGNAVIETDGRVDVDGRGFPSGEGPGASDENMCCDLQTGGAAHGGAGGDGRNRPGGDCYGSLSSPIELGSGAGSSYLTRGGAGGGALHLTIVGDLQLDGVISAAGTDGAAGVNSSDTGGGSGGSLWIDCNAFSGTGAITTPGGNGATRDGLPRGGGGGGGRIAVYYASSTFAGILRACGGDGFVRGGAGTVYTKPTASRATLTIDNCGSFGEATEFVGEVSIDADLFVTGQGLLSHPPGGPALHLDIAGNVTVAPDGVIAADARGFPSGMGPGASSSVLCCNQHTGGAGFGGVGGDGSNRPGGDAYGYVERPLELGSGAGASYLALGGAGGGAIRLTIDGDLVVHGRLSAAGANGASGVNGSFTGGGSGGSLWILAPSISGSGTISAPGGNGAGTLQAGGGAGGRIAIYSCQQLLDPSRITSLAGAGFQNGEPGTVYFGSSSISIAEHPDPLTTYRDLDVVTLSVVATTTQNPPTLSYRWRRNGIELFDGDLDGTVVGAATATLIINGIGCDDGGLFDAIISDSCGALPSDPAQVSVTARADFNLDGVLNSQDFFDFLNAFFSRLPSADFNADTLINSQDFFDFLTSFFNGCA